MFAVISATNDGIEHTRIEVAGFTMRSASMIVNRLT
jgi:hypothetical protein